MVTGSNNIDFVGLSKDSSLDGELIKSCHTIFNIRKNGLDILIANSSKTNILALGSYAFKSSSFNEAYLKELEELLLSIEFNFEDCLSTYWLLSLENMSLVPEEFFKESTEKDILRHNKTAGNGDVYKSELWAKHQIISCYSVPEVLEKWLTHNFGQSQIHHVSFGFAELFKHQPQTGTYLLLHVEKDIGYLFIANQGRIIFYNQFDYNAKEDLLYYLLFALEQNRILAPEVNLNLSGKLNSVVGIESLFSNYIGSVQKAKMPASLSLSPQLPTEMLLSLFHLIGGL